MNSKVIECPGCGNSFDSNYCPNCGEKSNAEKITFYSVSSNLFSAVTNMDRGLLYNLKNLTIAPRKTISSYLNGKRKGIVNPLSYAVLAITLYIILDTMEVFNQIASDRKITSEVAYNAGKMIRRELKYFWLLNIVLLSLFTKLFFKKYNFFEHLTINSFVIGHATFVSIPFILTFKMLLVFNPFVALTVVLMLFFFFKTIKKPVVTFLLSFISVAFCYVLFLTLPLLFLYVKSKLLE